MRRNRGGLTVVVAAALLVLGTATVLAAHGALRRSDPAAGSRVTEPLTRLQLEFTEAVEVRFVRITASDASGHRVDRPSLRFSDDRKVVTVLDTALTRLRGPVTVRWSIAGADGHPVEGTIRFVVDAPLPAEAPAPPPPMRDTVAAGDADGPRWGRVDGAIATALRWSHFVSLLALVGAWCATAWIVPIARRRGHWDPEAALGLSDRTQRFALIAILILAVALSGRSVAQASALDAGGLRGWATLITSTAWGRGWMLSALGAAGLSVFIIYRSQRPAMGGLAIGALAVGASAMGHAAAAPTPAAAVLTDAAHLLGAGVWAGSLGWLALIVLPAVRTLPSMRGVIVRSFSTVALGGAALLAISGVTNAWRYLGSIDALVTTSYGRVLLVKLGVLGVVAFTGFYNWRAVVPRIESEVGARRLRLTAGIELVAMLIVLAVAARLVVIAPPALSLP
jgi:copper transport protein